MADRTALAGHDLLAPSPPRITPLALLGLGRAAKVFQRNVVVYRRGWKFLVSGFFEPFFYLVSIGLGLSNWSGPSTSTATPSPTRCSWRPASSPPRR